MGRHVADGAALVAAAIQAAIQAGAPRRTVAAAAAAVAGIVLSASARPSAPRPVERTADAASASQEDASDPVQLLARLRAVRSAQRSRKKQRRRAAKQAANAQSLAHDDQTPASAGCDAVDGHRAGAAGQSAEPRGASAAAPAHAPASSPSARPPTSPRGLTLEQLPSQGDAAALDGFSDEESAHTMRAPSVAISAGMSSQGRSASLPSPYGRGSGGGSQSVQRK